MSSIVFQQINRFILARLASPLLFDTYEFYCNDIVRVIFRMFPVYGENGFSYEEFNDPVIVSPMAEGVVESNGVSAAFLCLLALVYFLKM